MPILFSRREELSLDLRRGVLEQTYIIIHLNLRFVADEAGEGQGGNALSRIGTDRHRDTEAFVL